jgi:hypothetical protein
MKTSYLDYAMSVIISRALPTSATVEAGSLPYPPRLGSGLCRRAALPQVEPHRR